ncbi:hypothetical protein GIB67_004069 [Kingdonia uniflora]|uniref:Protein kinase domain-containing protein n=1 Tax=Kingdonia uniflora TaxID=39325 RepID=A0A7J7NR28_9MAGN|nr:hypothetical protein GIB67_004069 [Kingdonia uniflora]
MTLSHGLSKTLKDLGQAATPNRLICTITPHGPDQSTATHGLGLRAAATSDPTMGLGSGRDNISAPTITPTNQTWALSTWSNRVVPKDLCDDPDFCPEGYVCISEITRSYASRYCKPEGKGGKLSPITVSFIALGGGLFLLTILAIAFWIHAQFKKRKNMMLKRKFFKRNGGLLLEQQISSGESNVEKTKIFVQEELMKATDNFNDSRVLGRGGSGTVYKGMLPDGRIINHRHIVKVLGCCLETEVPLLVYEFVSNGTLSEHLHKEEHISSISWEDRLRISKEIAGALAYLHSSASTPIFHRDIKSSNILLDENYKAKVSDFGISSFGVVLLELLTGQRPVSLTRSEEEANLAMNFISSVKEDRVFEVLETRVANEARKEEIQVVASLAKKCLKLVGKKRPTMKEVLTQLENLILFQRQESVCMLSDN